MSLCVCVCVCWVNPLFQSRKLNRLKEKDCVTKVKFVEKKHRMKEMHNTVYNMTTSNAVDSISAYIYKVMFLAVADITLFSLFLPSFIVSAWQRKHRTNGVSLLNIWKCKFSLLYRGLYLVSAVLYASTSLLDI